MGKLLNILELLPSLLFLIVGIFLFVLSGFKLQLVIPLIILILLVIYTIVYICQERLSIWVESKMRLDQNLQQLLKEDASIMWAYLSAFGLAFLIPGLTREPYSIEMLLAAMIFFVAGNLIYALSYLPRHQWLVRQRIIDLDLKKRKISKFSLKFR